MPPEASALTAHAALMAAGHRGNTDDVETLLRSPLAPQILGRANREGEAALQCWELDGGWVAAQESARSAHG